MSMSGSCGKCCCVQVLEYLIAGGVTKIISVGSCGVLEDIPENRFLIPVSALRDEGTSYHYLPPSREVEISKAGINAIESALSQKNIPYWEVKTWTTDGFYRETVEMVQYRKEEGCQVVEMECSALAACANLEKLHGLCCFFQPILLQTLINTKKENGEKQVYP